MELKCYFFLLSFLIVSLIELLLKRGESLENQSIGKLLLCFGFVSFYVDEFL